MIEICKILSGKYDIAVIPIVNRIWNLTTRRNDERFQKGSAKYYLWKHSFTSRVIDIWNSRIIMFSYNVDIGTLYYRSLVLIVYRINN